jgi:DNA-binding LacI/PurR family transcriptional regulator
VSRWFFATVVQGAEAVLREAGYDLLLYNLGGDLESRRRVFTTHLMRRRVDAVLVLSLTPNQQEISTLAKLHRPVAVIGANVPGWASVGIDDVAAASTAMQHLISLGHRRIAHLGGSLVDQLDFAAPRDRRAGYRRAMKSAGLPIDPAWEIEGDFTVHGGVQGMRSLLGLPPAALPTAVFAASDEMAIGAVAAVRRAGLRVPEDVSVIGIDDHEMAEFFDLTTVGQPAREQGRLAAAMLLAAMDPDCPKDAIPPTQIVESRLIVRGTTAAPTGDA